MCFDLDSLPPVPRIAGAAVSHNDIELEAADGNRFAAFEATPDEPNGIGVVILPDVRGLYRFYEELALRFAERGFDVVAIDYFGRTAGEAGRRLRLPPARRADDPGGNPGRRPRRRRLSSPSHPRDLHRRLLLRRP